MSWAGRVAVAANGERDVFPSPLPPPPSPSLSERGKEEGGRRGRRIGPGGPGPALDQRGALCWTVRSGVQAFPPSNRSGRAWGSAFQMGHRDPAPGFEGPEPDSE